MAALLTVDRGDVVRLTFPFTKYNTTTAVYDAADPTTVTVRAHAPSGAVTSYVYLTNAEVTRSGVGVFHLTLALGASGTWTFRSEGTGTVVAAEPAEVFVNHDPFA